MLYGVALIDAGLTACPEIAKGTQDGISMLGQGVSAWPVGPHCHDPVHNVSYVYPTADWLRPALAAIGVAAVAVTTAFNLTDGMGFGAKRRGAVNVPKTPV